VDSTKKRKMKDAAAAAAADDDSSAQFPAAATATKRSRSGGGAASSATQQAGGGLAPQPQQMEGFPPTAAEVGLYKLNTVAPSIACTRLVCFSPCAYDVEQLVSKKDCF
jgi:hypothetical protein